MAFIKILTYSLLIIFTFSNFVIHEKDIDDRKNKKEQRQIRKKERIKKFLKSKTGKFIIKQIKRKQEKRKQRLEIKLKKAQEAGKYKKAKRIKKGYSIPYWLAGIFLMIIGIILLIVSTITYSVENVFAGLGILLGWIWIGVGFLIFIIALLFIKKKDLDKLDKNKQTSEKEQKTRKIVLIILISLMCIGALL